MILLREGNIYFYFFTDLCTDQLIFKARDKAAGADRGLRLAGSGEFLR